MSNYGLAWLVVVAFAILGSVGMYKLLPSLRALYKVPLVALVFAFFTLPAPVPNYEGEIAPAFVVFIFELLFQIDGRPNTAGGILLIGCVAALVLAYVAMKLFARSKDKTVKKQNGEEAKR